MFNGFLAMVFSPKLRSCVFSIVGCLFFALLSVASWFFSFSFDGASSFELSFASAAVVENSCAPGAFPTLFSPQEFTWEFSPKYDYASFFEKMSFEFEGEGKDFAGSGGRPLRYVPLPRYDLQELMAQSDAAEKRAAFIGGLVGELTESQIQFIFHGYERLLSYSDLRDFFASADYSRGFYPILRMPNGTLLQTDAPILEALEFLETSDSLFDAQSPRAQARMASTRADEQRWKAFKYEPPKLFSERTWGDWFDDTAWIFYIIAIGVGCYAGYRWDRAENPTDYAPRWDSSNLY